MNKFICLLAALFYSVTCLAQKWVEMMQNPKINFYDVQKEFETYWSDKTYILEKMKNASGGSETLTEEEKKHLSSWKHFKRWEWHMAQRVGPTGERPPRNLSGMMNTASRPNNQTQTQSGNWSYFGPVNMPIKVSQPYFGGSGRVNCLRFDPNNSNIVYAGTPGGGLWKSTDQGASWTMWNTDNLPMLGISDIAIDPTNSQIMYIATGDLEGWMDNYSIGILKSTDGGITWNTTGLNWQVSSLEVISRILIDPSNTQIIHVGTSLGIYRSTDGGATFVQTYSTFSVVYDLEFKPDDPTVIFATSFDKILKSVDSGLSYAITDTITGARRIELGVTPANSNYLYALCVNSSYSFLGFYRSTDGALTFSTLATSPDILGSQAYYYIGLGVSPTNANEIVAGGYIPHVSSDGGVTWNTISYSNTFWHADIHDIAYINDSTVYLATDGGVHRSYNKGVNYTDVSNGLHIAEIYRFGQSASDPNLMITGWQDNGSNISSATTWTKVLSSDGMECFIDQTNNSVMYGTLISGLRRSTNGGANWSSINNGITGSANWVLPWQQDPVSPNTLWCGFQQIFKSVNQGLNWVQAGTIPGAVAFAALKVAPSNNQVIYAAKQSSIYISSNGGTTWSNITSGLPLSGTKITYIEVDPTDPDHVFVTLSGFSAGNKVYTSTSAGSSWSNYSDGLPNLPANTIVYNKNTNGDVYVGMDVGVFYRNPSMNSWVNFNNGLPNVIVNELEIQYTSGKIRAATYGRGVWESNLFSFPTSLPEKSGCYIDCFKIYPNPSSGVFTIETTGGGWENASVEVRNMLGQKILLFTIDSKNPQTFDLRNFGKGIYLVEIIKGSVRVQKKIALL